MPKDSYDCWWTIHGQNLRDALQRAHNGEDPELVYVELYANSQIEHSGDTDG